MIDFLIYDLKVAVLIAIFYMFYRLMLAKETFHRVNRIVLLLTAVASFLLPLCVITMHETVTMQQVPTVTVGDLQIEMVDEEPMKPLWQIALPIIFIIGMLATLAHTLWSLFRIIALIRRSEQHPQENGTTICVTGNAELSPFSWMHYIVMNRSDYETNDAAILAHERGHIHLRHSWDLILVDTLTALQWFNPAMWMLRSDLRAIHEYEADGAVLSQGINARQYQYLLITKAASIGGYSLANGISHSTLKNRINMMLHTQSSRRSYLKLLALLPIVAVTLAVNAEKVTDVVYTNSENPSVESLINETIVQAEAQPTEAEVVKDDEDKNFVATGTVLDISEAEIDNGIIETDKATPIIGAVVKVVGTKKGTVTGPDGKFKLEVSEGDELAAMYIGYETMKVVVNKVFSAAGNSYVIGLRKEGNSPKANANRAFDVVEQMPQFPGGHSKLLEYITRNLKYPAEAEMNCTQGRVIATFVVEEDGSISNAKIVRSIDPLLDAEALRIINTMPKWQPGMQNGKAVRVKYTIPISFNLPGTDSNATHNEGSIKSDEKPQKGIGVVLRKVVDDKEPLVLLDGKTIDSEKLKEIDPKTIESMQVLKNQEAKEKYGAQNGVILITTKKK